MKARAVWNPGDLLAFYGTGLASWCIEWGTWGPSHVGLVISKAGRPLIIEATTLCPLPCEIQKRVVDGVQVHDPAQRIQSYAGRVIRLGLVVPKDGDASHELTQYALGFVGEPYDLPAALMSGTHWTKFLRCVPYPDLASVFCSALCAHLLMFANRLNWSDPNYYNPANLVRAVRRQATHGTPERR